MEIRTRKSTALISLVLVPLNLLGLGFAGCDTRDEDTPNFASATDGSDASADGDDAAGFDFEDPNDPFNLDPVDAPASGSTGPVAYPTTQPLASSSFATLPPNHATHYYHSGPGLIFLPIPFRSGYQPSYRAPFRTSSSSSSVFRSTPSRSSGVSRSSSSGTSRGGFGSSAASHSASS